MLAIITTHPIQYQVPLWQALARDGRVPFEVWYLTSHATEASHDPEFGKHFAWDLDMLAGYPHRFLNVAQSARPGSFVGCRLTEKMRDRIRTAGVRAVWIQGWQVLAYWQAVWEAKAAGVEVWLRGESNDLAPVAWWKAPIKKLALDALFRRINRFLYIGTANRRLYQKFGVSEKRLFPAPYAVDNERFALQAKQLEAGRSKIREEWRIPEDAFVVLFCGKFIPKKRPSDVIKAAQMLLDLDPELKTHLLFVGSGELGAEMRAACNVVFDADSPPTFDFRPPTAGTKPPASFAGFLNQTEISRAYVAADVLVLPSDYGETWGLVVNEANASDLGAIVSDHCGCAEDLGSFPSNGVFKCGDVKDLASKLQQRSDGRSIEPSTSIKRHDIGDTVSAISKVWSQLL